VQDPAALVAGIHAWWSGKALLDLIRKAIQDSGPGLLARDLEEKRHQRDERLGRWERDALMRKL
jgi:hypothetical protein